MLKKKSYLLDVAKHMPPLYHKLPDAEFDINKSEVAQWLIKQPEILSYVVNRLKAGTSYIIYNPVTGKWQGADYEEDD